MKRKEVVELHHKSIDELKKQVADIRHEIAEVQLDFVTGKEKNTAKRKSLGQDLARALTILGTKEQNMVQSAVVPEAQVADMKQTKKTKTKKEEQVTKK